MSTVSAARVAVDHELPSAQALGRLYAGIRTGDEHPRLPVIAPFTGAVLHELPLSSVDDVEAAHAAARVAGDAWARTDLRERVRILRRFHDLLISHRDEGMDLIQWETGKVRRHAHEENWHCAVVARYYARVTPKALRPQRRSGVLPVLTRTRVNHHPKGVVSIVSPWNYPLSLGVTDLIPALMAGNAVLHRPDPQGSLTALWAQRLMREAGLPPDLWQVVTGGPDIGAAVVERGDYVTFTGSTKTGRIIAQAAAGRLKGASLELGGKNAALVLSDADIPATVRGMVRASFASAGQLCVSMERIYVDRSIHDEFIAAFVPAVAAINVGTGFGWDLEMGSLISQPAIDNVEAHVADARSKGALVLTGGRHRPDLGPYVYEPTVLAQVTPAMACFGDETFGPLVSIYPIDSDAHGVALANATKYGLNSSVWTGSERRGAAVAARLRSGLVNINEGYAAAFGSVDAPMGGMGDSGLGRRNAVEGLLKYTESQTVSVQRLLPLAEPPGVSYRSFAAVMPQALRLMKTLRLK